MFPSPRIAALAATTCLLLLNISCGGGSASPTPSPPTIGVTPAGVFPTGTGGCAFAPSLGIPRRSAIWRNRWRDLTALGTLTWGTQLTLDARTDPAVRPDPQPITPAQQMVITLPGYGVTFLELK